MTIYDRIELDDGYVIEIHLDESPSNPREDQEIEGSLLVRLSDRYLAPSKADEQDPRYDLVRAAWNHRGPGQRAHSTELVERYARAYLNAAAVGWREDHANSRLFCMVERGSDWSQPEEAVKAILAEYGAWSVGDAYGYVVTHKDGHTIEDDSCWGFLGDDSYGVDVAWRTVAQHLCPGTRVHCPDGTVDTIESIRDEIGWLTDGWGDRSPTILRGLITVFWKDRSPSVFREADPVTILHAGYMREQFMAVVEYDRAQRKADEEEIAEMAAAEIGAMA